MGTATRTDQVIHHPEQDRRQDDRLKQYKAAIAYEG